MGIFLRGSVYYTKFRVPKRYLSLVSGTHVVQSLKTDSEREARRREMILRVKIEEEWDRSLNGGKEICPIEVKAISEKSGFEYKSIAQVEQMSPAERVARLRSLPQGARADSPVTVALLGGLPEDDLRMSGLFDAYAHHKRNDIKLKTSEQFRVWKSARLRAINNFIAGVGDLQIARIDRNHALKFRDWQIERMEKDDLFADSINKDFNYLSAMLNAMLDAKRLKNTKPFAGLKLSDRRSDQEKARRPIPETDIRNIILNPRKMSGLDPVAYDVLLALVNTGARPSELIGLLPHHIILDAETPHVLDVTEN